MFRVEEILIVQGILAYGDDGNQYIIPSGASNQPFQVRQRSLAKCVMRTKNRFLQAKNSLATIVKWTVSIEIVSAFEWRSLFSEHAYSNFKVRKPRMTKL